MKSPQKPPQHFVISTPEGSRAESRAASLDRALSENDTLKRLIDRLNDEVRSFEDEAKVDAQKLRSSIDHEQHVQAQYDSCEQSSRLAKQENAILESRVTDLRSNAQSSERRSNDMSTAHAANLAKWTREADAMTLVPFAFGEMQPLLGACCSRQF